MFQLWVEKFDNISKAIAIYGYEIKIEPINCPHIDIRLMTLDRIRKAEMRN